MRLLFAFSFLLALTPTQLWAEACGCASIPSEGVYQTDGDPFELIYSAQLSQNGCPIAIRGKGKRTQGPDIDVSLQCEPGTNTWVGTEVTSFRGVTLEFGWRIKPPEAEKEPGVTFLGASHQSVLDSFLLDLDIPAIAKRAGKKDRRDIAFTLISHMQVPDCICNEVREEYRFVTKMMRAYSDKVMLENAQQQDVRGTDPRQWFKLSDTGELVEFASKTTDESYADRATHVANGGKSGDGNITTALQSKSQQFTKARGKSTKGVLETGAFAALEPSVDCTILPPDLDAARRMCTPDIIIKAALAHEREHKKRCETINRDFPTFKIGQTVIDYQAEDFDGSFTENGNVRILPFSAYYAWAQDPLNHRDDELAAYDTEARLLKHFLDDHCGGL